jgi:hypothetical protein
MGKALRVLVIIILILCVVSLIFANMLFAKRELLTKRNQILEETVIKVAKTIEAEDAESKAAIPLEKDIDPVEDRKLVSPQKQNMLDNYTVELETPNLPTFDLGSDKLRRQLRSLYVIDPATGEPVLDSLTQRPATSGKGSMQELLDSVFERAKVQQAKLNLTRDELKKMREKLSGSVDEINSLKTAGRETKVELTENKEQIASLENEKSQLEDRVAKLTAEKRELNAELADTQNELETITDQKLVLEEDLTKAKELIEALKEKISGRSKQPASGSGGGGGGGSDVAITALSAGDKATIIEANDDLKFAVLEFSDAAMTEMLGPERNNMLPQLEMNVRRPGHQSAAGEFITRVKLRQVVSGRNLVVADILSDWQQTTVEKGDVVFF